MQASFHLAENQTSHFTEQTSASSHFGGCVFLLAYPHSIGAIIFPKDAKADCIKRLQRSKCYFAFILDFVRNLNGLKVHTVT